MRIQTIISSGVFLTVTCYSQWLLVDDFQKLDSRTDYQFASEIGWDAKSIRYSSQYWILSDGRNVEDNALFIWTYNLVATDEIVWAIKPLPNKGIEENETGTLHFKFLQLSKPPFYFGTTDVIPDIDPMTGGLIQPGAWEDFNALMRINDYGTVSFWDDAGFDTDNTEPLIQHEQWYDIWMVIFNQYDALGNSIGSYSIFLQGPEDEEPILINSPEIQPSASSLFRRAPVDVNGNPAAIKWVMIAAHWEYPDMFGEEIWLVDDIYFSSGINLTNPLFYAGYPADGNRDVNTGDWLGWINVSMEPYVWLYSLSGWAYLDQPAEDDSGRWVFWYK